jgi:hypothetical protein
MPGRAARGRAARGRAARGRAARGRAGTEVGDLNNIVLPVPLRSFTGLKRRRLRGSQRFGGKA